MKAFRVGLALGGGAARGLSHIGALRAMEEAKIPIDVIAGTSAGALVGACYAMTRNVNEVRRRVTGFLQSKEFRKTKIEFLRERKREEGAPPEGNRPRFFDNLKTFLRKGVFYTSSVTRISYIPEENFAEGINAILEDVSVERTLLPFAAVAVDLISGEEVVLRKGSLRTAVRASCAIPGVFPPTPLNGMLLVDGGWVDPVPVDPARRLGANFVIAMDISSDIDEPGNLTRGIEVILRTNAVTRHLLKEVRLKDADVIIRPDVGDLHWADFGKVDEGIEKGYMAAKAKIPEIRSRLKKVQIKSLFSTMLRKVTPPT